jgi:hypothetical protein
MVLVFFGIYLIREAANTRDAIFLGFVIGTLAQAFLAHVVRDTIQALRRRFTRQEKQCSF